MTSASELANHHIATRQASLAQFEAGPARNAALAEMRAAFLAGHQAASDPAASAPLVRAGRDRERERIAGILGCVEAASRPAMARELALGSDMTLDAARKLLALAPEDRTGLIDRDSRAVLDAALRGAGIDPRSISVLALAMKAEGHRVVPDQPGPAPKNAGEAVIDTKAIYSRRQQQAAAASKPYERASA